MHAVVSDDQKAVVVGIFSGLLTFIEEGASKLALAFLVALVTGVGYKLGSIAAAWLVAKFKKRPYGLQEDPKTKGKGESQ